MDKSEKLALGLKMLKKFQEQSSPARSGGDGSLGTPPALSVPLSKSPAPPHGKNVRPSAAEGLKEISQEISSLLANPSVSISAPSLHNHTPTPHLHTSTLHNYTPTPHLHTSTLHNHTSLPSLVHNGDSSPSFSSHSLNTSTDDQSGIKNQIQAHAQTIDILVGEKSELEAEVSTLRATLSSREQECEGVSGRLEAAQRRLVEMEREKLAMTEEAARVEEALSQSSSEAIELRRAVERMRVTLDDQRQENTELVSKVTSQSAEISRLQTSVTELQSRLNMAELLSEQLSAGGSAPPPGPTPSQAELEELRGQVEQMRGTVQRVTNERDQTASDLGALRDTMALQQQDNARKLADVQTRLAEADARANLLSEELQSVLEDRECQLESVSVEQAAVAESSHALVLGLQQEKEALSHKLQDQVQNNAQMNRLVAEQEGHLAVMEEELSRLREQSVDQHNLLDTISQDKETISRAMSQNKELKQNLAELQDAFVRMSQQNMELASELETEHHRNSKLLQAVRQREAREEEEERGREKVDSGEGAKAVVTESHDFEAERDGLMERLQHLEAQHSALVEEHQRVLNSTALEGEGIGSVVNGVLDSSALQTSFSALQDRFVAVMAEKATLTEQIQEHEHLIVQLSGETETIGEYISLYQTQREVLRKRFLEKDQFIQGLLEEKEAMQAKLHELQGLVKQVLSERSSHPSHHHTFTSSPPPSHLSSSTTDIPLHLRPHSPSSPPHTPTPTPHTSLLEEPNDNKSLQILHLLGELEERGVVKVGVAPCSCCTGELVDI